MFLSKNDISRSAKQFCEMDLDLWGQNKTFFFHENNQNNQNATKITKVLMFLSNGISQSTKQFCVVDLDLWGQKATFFFQAFLTKLLMFLLKNCIL